MSQNKDANINDLKLITKNEKDSSLIKLRPRCITQNCDSVVYCYQDFYGTFLHYHELTFKSFDYYNLVDCAYLKIISTKNLAHQCLIKYYASVIEDCKLNNIRWGKPYRMIELRGSDAFALGLDFYKLSSTDPGYVAIDPAESFRFYVMEGMIKSIRGKSSTLLYNEAQLYFDDRKFYLIKDPLVYTKGVKDYWLDLYETAIKNKTIVYREYGDNVE